MGDCFKFCGLLRKPELYHTIPTYNSLFFSSYQDDRASVFPHGRNLNLLILVVVGASATASLIVGGLIFALASRRRGVAKNVSKLQLSDDIEESGKLEQQQEGYKVLIILLFKVF